MSEEDEDDEETRKPMTDEEIREYYRSLRDDLSTNIGKLEAMMNDPNWSGLALWLRYTLDQLRNVYQLLESANFAVRGLLSASHEFDSEIREFNKHKPTLEFIESTEMTEHSDVRNRDERDDRDV